MRFYITSLLLLALSLPVYSNNHFGNNLGGCGLTFAPTNLEHSANWKSKNITNNDQAQLKPYKHAIKYNTNDKNYIIKPINKRLADSLPKIGKWMMVDTKNYNDKTLPKNIAAAWVYWRGVENFIVNGVSQPEIYTVEPVNAVFVLNDFDNTSQANDYLTRLVEKLGYSSADSINHSGGYGIYFNDKFYSQLSSSPTGTDDKNIPLTFNKGMGEYTDHFRILGPYVEHSGGSKTYVYGMSVSRESQWFNGKNINCGNLYVSFNQAENSLITSMIAQFPDAKIYAGSLVNYITSDNKKDTSSTGDFKESKSFVGIFVLEKH
jgi:hypothetical protein